MKRILFLILSIAIIAACSSDNNPAPTPTGEIVPGDAPAVIEDSTLNSAKSHHTGTNCTQGSCHDGKKAALFVTAGSVFQAADADLPHTTGATLYLYSDEARTELLQTIEVDELGNFYSAKELDYGAYVDEKNAKLTGVFVTLVANEQTIDKIGRAPHGECNACHDHGQEPRIYAP